MTRLLREPLLHFGVLGAALLLLYAGTSGLLSRQGGKRIEIDAAEIALLAGTFERQWRRPPTLYELRSMARGRVREEVLYREAVAMGLDENDLVVRRRMVQKMELLSQDLALLADPTDEELAAFFAERRDDYRLPPRVSFSHVYFNADRRGAATEQDARRELAELREERPPPRRDPERGDRFMLAHDYVLQSPVDVQRLFGSQFTAALFELEPGWHGPVASSYGLHLVHVGERVEGRLPELEEVRGRLLVDYDRERRERANAALYDALAAQYVITIEEETMRSFALPAESSPAGRSEE